MKFGSWLLKTRKSKGLKQRDVAERGGLSKSYISLLENDRHHGGTNAPPVPTRDILRKIATGLGVSAAEAFEAAGYSPEGGVEFDIGPEARFLLLDGSKFDEQTRAEYERMIRLSNEMIRKMLLEEK